MNYVGVLYETWGQEEEAFKGGGIKHAKLVYQTKLSRVAALYYGSWDQKAG